MNPESTFIVAGIDSGDLSLEERGTIRLLEVDVESLLKENRAQYPNIEIVILASCSRTEFYLAGPTEVTELCSERLINALLYPATERFGCRFFRFAGVSARRHLLRSCCGLESKVNFDRQPVEDLAAALFIARRYQEADGVLLPLIEKMIQFGRSNLLDIDPSLWSGLTRILSSYCWSLSSGLPPRILIVGAGRAAHSAVRYLKASNSAHIDFVNRSESKAFAMARKWGGKGVLWDSLYEAIPSYDAIICAVSSPEPIARRSDLERVEKRCGATHPLFFDLGVPPNIERGVPFRVFTITDIFASLQKAHVNREDDRIAMECLIEERLAELDSEKRSRGSESSRFITPLSTLNLSVTPSLSSIGREETAECDAETVSALEDFL